MYDDEETGEINTIAIYTRVSTEDQAREGFSLDSQLRRLKEYCRSRQWTVAGIYVDEGYSGRNTKRPNYQKMIEDIDKWDGIVVIKMDRVHRNQKNFTKMIENFKKKGKQFVSLTESYDTSTAMGRFFMDLCQRLAQLESEIIGERVYDGMRQKAKDTTKGMGLSQAPFGYEMVDGQLIEIPEKLEIVKKIFELAKQDLTPRKIGKKLGIHFSSVFYRLHHSIYCGVERWCQYYKPSLFFKGNNGGKLDPIVSIKEWNKIQRKLVSRRCDRKDTKPLQIPENLNEAWEIAKKDLKKYARIVKNKQYNKE